MKNDNDTPLIFYIVVSIILHIFVYFLFHFSLPFFKKDPIEEVMTFEVVPVEETSNIQTQKHQKQEEKKADKAKKRAKAKKKDPKSAPKPKKALEKPKEQKKIAPKPAPKKAEQKPKDSPKPKPKVKVSPKANEMEQLLKNLEKESQGKEEKSRKQAISQKNTAIDDAIGKYKENSPMSIAEEKYIYQKIVQNWNIPIGVQGVGEIVIGLHINLKTDGEIAEVNISNINCPPGADLACKAFADSAVRAVMQAAPFDQLAQDRYEIWSECILNFNPKDALM